MPRKITGTTTSEVVRRARLTAGMSVPELAEKSGIHARTLYRIEEGDANPQMSTVRALAKALGLKPADLVLLDDSEVA